MALSISPTSRNEITGESLITTTQLESFGHKLLTGCIVDKQLFDAVCPIVNFNTRTKKHDGNDFIDMIDGLAFGSMQEFASCWVPGNPWPRDGAQWAAAASRHLTHFFQKHPEFPEMYRLEAIKRLAAPSLYAPGDGDLICDGLVDYIRSVRRHYHLSKASTMTPSARQKADEDMHASVLIPGSQVTFVTATAIMEEIFAMAAPTTPWYSGIGNLDYHYGSRALAGDSWLAFGHPGGGKTNLACQIAGRSAQNNRLVMYVTTEVKRPIILLRACAGDLGRPYATLKAMAGTMGNHPSAAEFASWVHGPGSNIGVMDYREFSGVDYKEKFKRMMDTFVQAKGRVPDIILWDWIGKALDSGFADPWQKREAYNGVATLMVDTAAELNIQTFTLAQASKETKNRSNLSEQDTADSKSLCDGMTGVVGITSLMDNTESNAGEKDCHRVQQYLVVCKCREQLAQRLSVIRRFDMARFESNE